MKHLTCVSIVAAAMLAACAPMADVHVTKPRLELVAGGASGMSRPEQLIANAEKSKRRDPLGAMGACLEAADSAQALLIADPSNSRALRDYNFALSRLFEVMNEARVAAWSRPLGVPSPGGEYLLSCRTNTSTWWKPADYALIPADQLVVAGTAFKRPVRSAGLGAPLVGVNEKGLADYRGRYLWSKKVYYTVTAVARFRGRQCVITFEDPYATSSVNLGSRSFPLAGDYSAAAAMMLANERPERLGLVRLFIPERYASTAHISMLQPYDPKKIPVLFVHGLQDTAATWTWMINTLRADPVIRRRYQFWVFSYPSGYPFPYSATLLRADLDALHKTYPDARPMVLVGHSMGGLICRLMVTDTGNKIWLAYFKKPPAETRLPSRDKALLSGALIFKHRTDVARVIFISTPHRGSILAANWIGRLASHIVRAPQQFVDLAHDVVQLLVDENGGAITVSHIPNSIDTLAPDNRFLRVLNTLPITVPYYSIMGDRGRGDTPHSSDGVVAYASSHLDGAVSECIVPVGHDAHQTAPAIAEVDRILRLPEQVVSH